MNALDNIGLNTIKTTVCTTLGLALKNTPTFSRNTVETTLDFFKNLNQTKFLQQLPENFNTCIEIDSNWTATLLSHLDVIGLAGGAALNFSIVNEVLKITPGIKNAPKARVLLAATVTIATIGSAQFFFDPSINPHKAAEVAYRYFITATVMTGSLLLTKWTFKSIKASTEWVAWGINGICSGVIRAAEIAQPMSWPTSNENGEPVCHPKYHVQTTPVKNQKSNEEKKKDQLPILEASKKKNKQGASFDFKTSSENNYNELHPSLTSGPFGDIPLPPPIPESSSPIPSASSEWEDTGSASESDQPESDPGE